MVRAGEIVKRLMSFGPAILVTFLFTGGIAGAQNVKTDYVKDYHFGALKRFAWKANHLVTQRHPDDNKLLDKKIMRAVAEQLAAKGIVEDAANPDFYLFYHAGPGEDGLQVGAATPEGLDSMRSGELNPAGSPTWTAGAGTSVGVAPNVWYSVQGKFVFYVVDSKSKTVIWEGTATKKWSDPQKARKNEDKEIKQVVDKSFKDFPPKSKR
jgi:hypothetical protein